MVNPQAEIFDRSSKHHLTLLFINLRTIVASLSSSVQNAPSDNHLSEAYFKFKKISVQLETLATKYNLNLSNPTHTPAVTVDTDVRAAGIGHYLTYCSPAMRKVIQLAERAARRDTLILITGETGVGKELVARFIHLHSSRATGPLIPFNCAAVPKELFENQMFGHKQGAFTGAVRDQAGILRSSSGGTLFLDEVGELPFELQPKLLRFLQDGEIHTIGENRPSHVNVRVIAATNRDLESEVSAGRFRSDLFHRLNVLSLEVPPIRERREDIPLLIDFFSDNFSRLFGTDKIQFSPEALECLNNYDWPGNVREISNLVLRFMTLDDGHSLVSMPDLPPAIARARASQKEVISEQSITAPSDSLDDSLFSNITLAEAIGRVERQKVREALIRHNWNFVLAARQLGLSTFGLRKKYRRLFAHELGDTTFYSNEKCDE